VVLDSQTVDGLLDSSRGDSNSCRLSNLCPNGNSNRMERCRAREEHDFKKVVIKTATPGTHESDARFFSTPKTRFSKKRVLFLFVV